jgi:hypothetical protein
MYLGMREEGEKWKRGGRDQEGRFWQAEEGEGLEVTPPEKGKKRGDDKGGWRKEEGGRMGGLSNQLMKDDLPAEWLPTRRHVTRSRGGRMLAA